MYVWWGDLNLGYFSQGTAVFDGRGVSILESYWLWGFGQAIFCKYSYTEGRGGCSYTGGP